MPGKPDTALVSMGIYIFDTEFLFQRLIEDALARPPLRGFHAAVHTHGVVLLDPLLGREKDG